MMNDVIHVGYTVKKKVFIAIFAGLLSLGGIIAAFGFTSTVFALPIAAMGDFYVLFDELEGEGFVLHPHLDETNDSEPDPTIRNKMKSVTIHGLHIYKDIKLPNGKWFRINVTSSQPTTIKGLIQDARVVDANLEFQDMSIAQKNTSDMSALEAFKQNWTHDANTVKITDAIIRTNYLYQDALNLQGAQISIESIDQIGPGDGVGTGGRSGQPGSGSKITDGTGPGGLLPKTATSRYTLIVVGGLIVLFGAFLIYRKKTRVLK